MGFDPYAPPKADTKPERDDARHAGASELPRVWAEGPNLAVRLDATIPAVCLKCGVTSSIVRREHAYTWMPAGKRRNALIARMMFGAIGGAVMEASNAKHRRNAKLSLPLCEPCDHRWAQGKKIGLAVVGAFFLSFVFIFYAQSERLLGPMGLLGVLFGAIAALVVVSRMVVPPRYVHAERIEDSFIVLRGVAELAVTEAVRLASTRKKKKKAAMAADPDPLVDDPGM